MKHRNLKTSFKQHVESQSLSAAQLDQLMAMQAQHAESARPLKRYVQAAAFALILLSGWLFHAMQTPEGSLDQRIGSEVVKNHIKLKPLEVQTNDMQAIREYFTELDFSPIQSQLLADNNSTLLGGRYCSIQGVTAAQLRLKDKSTGQIQSLYQTVYDENVFSGLPKLEEGGKPVTVYANGVAVEIWVEKGVLFAITKAEK